MNWYGIVHFVAARTSQTKCQDEKEYLKKI